MKRLILTIALFAPGVFPMVAAPKTEASAVPAHYEIRTRDFWRYITPDSLPLNNRKNIKSVEFITPVYDGDEEVMGGDKQVLNYNRSGRLTSGSFRYGDASGGYDFKVDYSDYGIPSKIVWTSKVPCQDCSEPDGWVVTEYIPLYGGGGRLQQIRETTTSVGGKKVNSVHKYVVTPGPTGAPKKVICLEDNSLVVNFNDNGYNIGSNIYSYIPGSTGPKWELITETYGALTEEGFDPENGLDWQYTLDSKGNWTRKVAKISHDDGTQEEIVRYCNIQYY